MKKSLFLVIAIAVSAPLSGHRDQSIGAESAQTSPQMTFFVTSTGNKTANLGGLRGAASARDPGPIPKAK